MNFFEHQAKARGSTKRLIGLFMLAVAAIVLAIDAVVLAVLMGGNEQPLLLSQALQMHGGVLAGVTLTTLLIIAGASLYKSTSLRSGGGAVARSLGGTLVPTGTREPQLRRLRNVVEEIAIASGVPVPEIYVLDEEEGINAFAAGWSPADAAVAVTRGTLEKLNRAELQGVIAHEFSHVLNGDMRLNIRLMGVLFGILVIAVIGREVLDASRRGGSRKNGGAIVLIALGVMCVGYIGLFFCRIIKASVSRSREYLADASAVQFTRQSSGIAGALKKIAGIDAGSKLSAPKGEEVSHMLFGDGIGYSRLFATHPPLLDRIRRIDPQFRMEQLGPQARQWNEPGYLAEDPQSDAPVTSGLAASANATAPGGSGGVAPDTVSRQVGVPGEDDYRLAEVLHAAIPDALLAIGANDMLAMPLLLAMLLDPEDEAVRARQLQQLETRLGPNLREVTTRLLPRLAGLARAQRLPMAALAFPALRQRPRAELERFLLVVNELIQADGAVCMFEFCLGTLLRVQVTDALFPTRAQAIGKEKLGHARAHAVTLLAVLAQEGSADATRARHAYAAGLAHLFQNPPEPYAPAEDPAAALQTALPALDKLDGPGKQLLIEGMVKTLSHDGRVTVGESELLRAICGALHCPLPPVLRQ